MPWSSLRSEAFAGLERSPSTTLHIGLALASGSRLRPSIYTLEHVRAPGILDCMENSLS
jgi:hypothetical protein